MMIALNETVRLNNTEKNYKINHLKTINSGEKNIDRCTWACHNDTEHCKKHHVKFVKGHYKLTDQIYFGIINTLQSSKAYQAANVLLFVVLIPLIIYFFLVQSIRLQFKINQLQKNN